MALEHYMVTGGQIRKLKAAEMSRGFSLIELMISMAVLAVGLLGGIVVIAVATANDGRSKLHTTAVTLASNTMEKILAIPQKATGGAAQTKLTDCAVPASTFTIETAPGGSVDFSQAPQPNYSMRYVMCSTGTGVTYDVRWSIDAGPTPSTQLVTVSAKPVVGNGAAAALFTLPFTLHQLRGNF